MALSNWDTLAFGGFGESCNGCAVNHRDNSVHIYKNWLYVRSPEMWKEGQQFTNNTIAEIQSGDIRLAGFEIQACRGPQNAIFVQVKYYDGDVLKYFGGIGCYGFKDKVEEILRKHNRLEEYSDDWNDGSTTALHYICNSKTGEEIVYHDDEIEGKEYDSSDDWVGVLPTTLQKFLSWLESLGGKPEYNKAYFGWISRIKESEKLRFNQGDAYFATCDGTEIPATPVGESRPSPTRYYRVRESRNK